MPALELKDKIFGFWKVLEQDIPLSREKKQSYWLCECQLCGTIKSVRGSALTSGKSTKCNSCNLHKITTDETNKVYNKLTVIQFAGTKNNRKMWLCKCECGNLIEVSTTDLRTGKVQSCGKCPTRQSNGESWIKQMLINANIPYIQEYKFDNFVYDTGHQPRFDFYIPSRNYVIEYDGKQHFECCAGSSWNNKNNLLLTQQRDKIKNQYCFDNNIAIIRIPYTKKLNELTIFDLIPETSEFLIRKE